MKRDAQKAKAWLFLIPALLSWSVSLSLFFAGMEALREYLVFSGGIVIGTLSALVAYSYYKDGEMI